MSKPEKHASEARRMLTHIKPSRHIVKDCLAVALHCCGCSDAGMGGFFCASFVGSPGAAPLCKMAYGLALHIQAG